MLTRLSAITLFLALTAFAVGARAQILWHLIHSDQIADTIFAFQSISCSGNNCTTSAVIFVGSSYKQTVLFYESTDGGKTWFSQVPNVSYPTTFRDYGFTKIQRIDSLNIVGISDSGFVIRTFDGGETWERQSCPTPYILMDVHFSDPMTGIIGGGGNPYQIFITSDGGRHWDFAPFPGLGLWQCHSYGSGKFRFFKYKAGPFYTTYDNFRTVDSTKPMFDSLVTPRWYAYLITNCTFGGGDTILGYGTFFQKDTIPAFGGYGLIMRSVDGGSHWEKPYTFPTEFFSQIDYTTQLDRDTVIAIGMSNPNILLSTDRGYSWKVDSLLMDTSYYTSTAGGISMAGDGHPIAILSPGQGNQSILLRGEWAKLHVDYIERIIYFTKIYPNPASGVVNITSIDVSKPIHIMDIFGNEVMHGILSDQGKLTLDVSKLSKGVYDVLIDHYDKRFAVGKIAVIGN